MFVSKILFPILNVPVNISNCLTDKLAGVYIKSFKAGEASVRIIEILALGILTKNKAFLRGIACGTFNWISCLIIGIVINYKKFGPSNIERIKLSINEISDAEEIITCAINIKQTTLIVPIVEEFYHRIILKNLIKLILDIFTFSILYFINFYKFDRFYLNSFWYKNKCLNKVFNTNHVAILISSHLFIRGHASRDYILHLPTGLVNGYLASKYGVGSAIISHIFKNSIAVFFQALKISGE